MRVCDLTAHYENINMMLTLHNACILCMYGVLTHAHCALTKQIFDFALLGYNREAFEHC